MSARRSGVRRRRSSRPWAMPPASAASTSARLAASSASARSRRSPAAARSAASIAGPPAARTPGAAAAARSAAARTAACSGVCVSTTAELTGPACHAGRTGPSAPEPHLAEAFAPAQGPRRRCGAPAAATPTCPPAPPRRGHGRHAEAAAPVRSTRPLRGAPPGCGDGWRNGLDLNSGRGRIILHVTATPTTPPSVRAELFGPERRATTVGLVLLISLVAFEAMGSARRCPRWSPTSAR
jgi:hypothetical protein